MKRLSVLCLLILLLSCCALGVRAQTSFAVMGGGGLSFLAGKKGTSEYQPSYTLGGLVQLRKFFSSRLALETGLGYQYRQFRKESTFIIDEESKVVSDGELKYRYLNIPLQLGYKAGERKNHSLWCGGGFRYGFLLDARYDGRFYDYHRGVLVNNSPFSTKHRVAMTQSETKPVNEYLFNVAVEAHATWYWRKRLSARLFYDYSLYDADAMPEKGARMHMHVVGLMAGYTLR